jgi:predicted GIY-YIG superfamily endonuclease
MPARQLHLFALPRPLIDRLGEAFFRAVPRGPGVYVMTGEGGRVLYIGQSGNLRARLASYKNARPNRVPRRVIRLVHTVQSITWELCESAEGARLRENELLRLHRPRFNRLNTWPRAYSYIRLLSDESGLELGLTRNPDTGGRLYGAFKTRAMAGYGALLRLVWAVLHQPSSPHDFPAQMLGSRPPRLCRFQWQPNRPQVRPDLFLSSLHSFLAGASDHLLQLLGEALPTGEGLSPFQRALHAADLDTLAQFYGSGPRRNCELSRQHNLPGLLIAQEELDDLLALKA